MRWTILLALAAWLAADPAEAQKAAPGGATAAAPAARIAALPAELGGFRRSGEVIDFEQRPNGAGLGAAVEYRPAQGSGVATVYVYDRRRPAIAPEAAPAAIDEELRIAGREIEAAAETRRYRIAAQERWQEIPGPGRTTFRCNRYDLAFENGSRVDSFACVGVAQGRFLKLRLSMPAGAKETTTATVTTFARALLAAAG